MQFSAQHPIISTSYDIGLFVAPHAEPRYNFIIGQKDWSKIPNNMRKSIAYILAASTLFVTGCSTTAPHLAQWEYKVVTAPKLPNATQANQQEFLNELGKDSWILVSEDNGTFYLMRRLP